MSMANDTLGHGPKDEKRETSENYLGRVLDSLIRIDKSTNRRIDESCEIALMDVILNASGRGLHFSIGIEAFGRALVSFR